jgi:flagellar hook-associated protein 3 FlgL
MRVTNQMMTETAKRNLFRQSSGLLRQQEIVSSGKRINRPSDDPIGMGQVLGYRRSLNAMDQYQRNMQAGRNRIEFVETTLDAAEELVVQAKNWAVNQASSATTDRDAAINDVRNLREQLLQLANSKMGSTYIFAGHQTGTAPFADDGTYNGDSGGVTIITGERRQMSLEADGSRIFQGKEDLFTVLDDLLTGLETDDVDLIAAQATRLEAVTDQIQLVRAEGAARYQQLDLAENQTSRLQLTVETLLSETESANLEEAILELQGQETAYEVALQVAADVIQPTLMNFLR